MSTRSTPGAVLFDLDGTLLDTAPDMAAALNRLRDQEGLAPLPFDAIRPHVSHGAVGLVRLAFDGCAAVRFESLRQRFLQIYSERLAVDTRLFDGMAEVLDYLERSPLPWGIVTNKPAWLTEPLLGALQLADRAACLVCGDTLPERKPHPLPLLHAARQLAIAPEHCVYIGDAERDVQAGRAAGMRTVVAGFGYIDATEDVDAWQADVITRTPATLLRDIGFGADATA